MKRLVEVDTLRGIAIVLMVIYHIFFDLSYFRLVDINLYELGWQLFQRNIGTLFILIVGISLTLSENRNKEGYKRHAKRGLKLAGIALLITVATWIYPHEGFIMFGIIHLIALSTFIAPFFFKFGKWNLVLGLLIILLGFYVGTLVTNSHYLFWLGIVYPGYMQLDHYSLIPWFGVVLVGMYIGNKLFPGGKSKLKLPTNENLAFLGRNALLIYVIHQPILIGVIMASIHLRSFFHVLL
ncbi:DUF1624 domain-containing protein [Patescibacteria group bacterium]|nr:DUF1624 domain-containing protein [Candidatus Micrarchaeota archaeon]MBU1758360.1 DUF1624 domain-containing protein [Patescibacteria group bacterium]